jgi:hypothetical protein
MSIFVNDNGRVGTASIHRHGGTILERTIRRANVSNGMCT